MNRMRNSLKMNEATEVGSRAQGAHKVRGILSSEERAGVKSSVNLTSSTAHPGNEVCFLARPRPDLLPREKEQPLAVSGFANTSPANPAARISLRRRTILPLLGGEGRGEVER